MQEWAGEIRIKYTNILVGIGAMDAHVGAVGGRLALLS